MEISFKKVNYLNTFRNNVLVMRNSIMIEAIRRMI